MQSNSAFLFHYSKLQQLHRYVRMKSIIEKPHLKTFRAVDVLPRAALSGRFGRKNKALALLLDFY